jgi:hypothetical protein
MPTGTGWPGRRGAVRAGPSPEVAPYPRSPAPAEPSASASGRAPAGIDDSRSSACRPIFRVVECAPPHSERCGPSMPHPSRRGPPMRRPGLPGPPHRTCAASLGLPLARCRRALHPRRDPEGLADGPMRRLHAHRCGPGVRQSGGPGGGAAPVDASQPGAAVRIADIALRRAGVTRPPYFQDPFPGPCPSHRSRGGKGGAAATGPWAAAASGCRSTSRRGPPNSPGTRPGCYAGGPPNPLDRPAGPCARVRHRTDDASVPVTDFRRGSGHRVMVRYPVERR